MEDTDVVIYSIKKWNGNNFREIIDCVTRMFLLFLGHGFQVIDINDAFDNIIRHMSSRKIKVSDIQNSSSSLGSFTRAIIYKYRRRSIWWMFRRDGRARLKEAEDVCRQSTSRQMSDNTIAWWVWMTGSFVSFSLSSFIFIFFVDIRESCQESDNVKSIFCFSLACDWWETKLFSKAKSFEEERLFARRRDKQSAAVVTQRPRVSV